jgi:hypothetical protein
VANGTEAKPIIFTSLKDDMHGGDTNGDGSSTMPDRKDWGGINTNDENGSSFKYCHFYYGGNTAYSSTLTVYGNGIRVENCLFVHNSGDDASGWYGALDATYGGSTTVIKNNVFYANTRPLSINTAFSIDDSNIFSDPDGNGPDNTYNGIFVETIDETTSVINWGETEVAFVIDDNDWWIYNGGVLNLANNVVLKFRPGSAMVIESGASSIANHNGTGVWFTSYKDDTKKGDTNGDGNLTTPVNGDWLGIYDNASYDYVSWANLLYSGE